MTATFQIVTIPGERPSTVPAGMLAMYAPRPLYGTEVNLDPRWGWAGQVIVDPTDKAMIENNRRLDARLVQWITPTVIAARHRADLIAQYGTERSADIHELPDAEIIQMALTRNVQTINLDSIDWSCVDAATLLGNQSAL